MSKDWEKYLKKQPPSFRLKITEVLEKLRAFDFKSLDIKKLKGREHEYRVRVGKFRIIFHKGKESVKIIGIDPRGDVY